MLKLREAASFFDRTEVKDAYTGATLFYGQIDPYDDVKRDAGTAYRRVLSVAPGTSIPEARAVRVFGVNWLVGREEIDGLEEQHRAKYVLQPAPQDLTVSSLDGFLTGASPRVFKGGVEWAKDGKEMGESSDVFNLYSAFLAQGSEVSAYQTLCTEGLNCLVLSVREQPSGYRVATAIKLDYAKTNATVQTRVYDPVSGAYQPSANTLVPCQRVRWQNLFAYNFSSAARYQEGDDTLVLPAGTQVNTASLIMLAAEPWKVVSVDTLGDAVTVHARPAWAS